MKNLMLLLLFTFFILSCEDNELDWRNNINKSTFYGTWEDVSSLPDNFNGVPPTFKSSVFRFNENGTYNVIKNTSPLDIYHDGVWDYNDETQTITFDENYQDTIPVYIKDYYSVEKSWKIVNFQDNKISVNYRIFREETLIYSDDSTEVLDTISAIDVTMYRALEKQE